MIYFMKRPLKIFFFVMLLFGIYDLGLFVGEKNSPGIRFEKECNQWRDAYQINFRNYTTLCDKIAELQIKYSFSPSDMITCFDRPLDESLTCPFSASSMFP